MIAVASLCVVLLAKLCMVEVGCRHHHCNLAREAGLLLSTKLVTQYLIAHAIYNDRVHNYHTVMWISVLNLSQTGVVCDGENSV